MREYRLFAFVAGSFADLPKICLVSSASSTGDPITPPWWLVWSIYADGVGVVYRRPDGKEIILTGWKGDFCII